MRAYWEPEGYYQLGEDPYEGVAAIEVLERMMEVTGSADLAELARWLGVGDATLADMRRRNIVPIRWVLLLALQQKNYNPHWVLTGSGDKLW